MQVVRCLMTARRIGIVTVGRSDYGIYRPVFDAIRADPDLEFGLFVSGTHLCPEFDLTVETIEQDGYPILERIQMLAGSDLPAGIADSMGRGTSGFGRAFARNAPDILVVLGDRFEMHAAAVAAVPFCIPIAHIHGGEITEGAFDNALRHSLTKLSHLHFTSTEIAARRVIAMGETPHNVVVCGAPGLDNLATFEPLDRRTLQSTLGLTTDGPFLLVSYHPVTLERHDTDGQVGELLAAIDQVGLPAVFGRPNADTAHTVISRAIDDFVDAHPDTTVVGNLATRTYFSAMAMASAMVGNSSSGIIEAASLRLPVVNVGTRQAGRERSANTIDVGNDRSQIQAGINRALSPEFKKRIHGIDNVYGDGHAAERIVARLKTTPLDDTLIRKTFVLS